VRVDRTLLLGLALGVLTILGGYLLLVGLVFMAIALHEMISKHLYLDAAFFVVMYLMFAGVEFVLARKTIRTLNRWRQQP
jgi:hypothetical protein